MRAPHEISFECLWDELNAAAQQGRASSSTYEAIAYALRERGLAALDRDVNRQRLAQLSEQQLKDLIVRMRREQSRYPAAPITDALLCFLAEVLP
jgi:hypothetical protein